MKEAINELKALIKLRRYVGIKFYAGDEEVAFKDALILRDLNELAKLEKRGQCDEYPHFVGLEIARSLPRACASLDAINATGRFHPPCGFEGDVHAMEANRKRLKAYARVVRDVVAIVSLLNIALERDDCSPGERVKIRQFLTEIGQLDAKSLHN